MILPLAALKNPFLEELLLLGLQHLVRFRRRHQVVLVRGHDPAPELALLKVARSDRRATLLRRFIHAGLGVQAKTSLARGGVGAMTGEAGVAEERPDVAIELHLRFGTNSEQRGRKENGNHQPPGAVCEGNSERLAVIETYL